MTPGIDRYTYVVVIPWFYFIWTRKICVYTKSALYLFNINQIKNKKSLQKMFIGPYHMIDILKKNVLRKKVLDVVKLIWFMILQMYNHLRFSSNSTWIKITYILTLNTLYTVYNFFFYTICKLDKKSIAFVF